MSVYDRRLVAAALFLATVVGAGPLRAQDNAGPKQDGGVAAKAGPLDIIGVDALGAIAIRNVEQLTKRGDKLITDSKLRVPMRLSDGYQFVVGILGVRQGLDKQGSAALMVFNRQFDADALVLAVPVADFGLMAGNFNLTAEQLKSGKVFRRKPIRDNPGAGFADFVASRGNHVFIGGSEKSVQHAVDVKPLRTVVAKADAKTFRDDDIFGMLHAAAAKPDWERMVRDFDAELRKLGEVDEKTLRDVADGLAEMRHVFLGMRLDGGLGATLSLNFSGDVSRKILTRLQRGDRGKTTLAGLPAARALAAHGSTGNGQGSNNEVRALVLVTLRGLPIEFNPFISARHRTSLVSVFGHIWQSVRGSRSALYESSDPAADGLVSLVAVLDTGDGPAFIDQVRELSDFVNASNLTDEKDRNKIAADKIETLVAQLGDSKFSVRQLAMTKLVLLGSAALPALEKARDSASAEVRFRAEVLRKKIAKSLTAQRKELLENDLLSKLKPKLGFTPKAEVRAGTSVHLLHVLVDKKQEKLTADLRKGFGPDWNQVRLAAVGRHVVVLLGSNVKLFEQAIGNVKAGRAGLDSHPVMQQFRGRAHDGRTMEYHIQLARILQIVSGRVPDKLGNQMTSFGLSIRPQKVRFDLFVPPAEIKAVGEAVTEPQRPF